MFVFSVRKWNPSVVLSVAAHLVLLVVLLWQHQTAIFVTPNSVAQGNGPISYRLTYLASSGGDEEDLVEQPRMSATSRPVRARHAAQRKQQTTPPPTEGDLSDRSVRAGTPFGSLFSGPASGHDIRPGYPVVFPDPIARGELPGEINGDVVVEVTVDDRGNVIDAQLLQGVGHGIDEKIVSTLRQWHYHPATMDGRPIASKHDVHFHLPS